MIKKIFFLIITIGLLLAWQRGYFDDLKKVDWRKIDQVWKEVRQINLPKKEPLVVDFNSCVAAGNPVLESYPRQCSYKDQIFLEIIK